MTELSPFEWALRPMKRYAQFTGRAPRAEYWWFYLATMVGGLICDGIDSMAGSEIGVLGIVFNLAVIIPSIAVTVRRLHDIDRSGWWLVVLFVPFVAGGAALAAGSFDDSVASLGPAFWIGILVFLAAAILLLVFLVTRGDEGPNRYGEDPYGRGNLEEIFA